MVRPHYQGHNVDQREDQARFKPFLAAAAMTTMSASAASAASASPVASSDVARANGRGGGGAPLDSRRNAGASGGLRFRGYSADRGRDRSNYSSASFPPHPVSAGTLNFPPNSSRAENNGHGGGGSAGTLTPYERLLWQQRYNEQYQKELTLGRRIGFYRFRSDLGTGNFSKVKLAQHQLTKERVAVKMIDKTRLDAKTQKMVLREIQIMDSLCHPCLIRLYEVAETVSSLHLIMEYAPGGELFVRLTEDGRFGEEQAKVIFAQVASAVEYMHDHNFIHRDLKAENVFFSGPLAVKVGDFGFATEVNKIDQHLTTFCGSPPYAAPELFQDDHYLGPSVDLWALGILLYFLVTGSMPFKGNTVAALKHAILDGSFSMPDYLSETCTDLISGMLRRKPQWRMTMDQIRESHWLSGVPWSSPDTRYRPLPSHRLLERSDEEDVVREKLDKLGVTEELLNAHIERGARSQIVGAYRILLHRETLGHQKPEDVGSTSLDDSRSNSGRLYSASASARTPMSLSSSLADTASRERPDTALSDKEKKKKKTKKSKLCTLL